MRLDSNELMEAACPVCQAAATAIGKTPKFEGIDATVLLKCGSCDHQWLVKPEQVVKEIAETMMMRNSTTLYANWILRWIPKDFLENPGLRVMDVGCWDGSLLQQLPPSWVRHGIELNEIAVSEAKARGLEVRQGKLSDIAMQSGKYDLVLMLDVLEHIVDPVSALRDVAEILSPSGIFLALTGNGASASARIFRTRWYYLNYPEHVSFFTPSSARIALTLAGLKSAEIKEVRHHASECLGTLKKVIARLGRRRLQGSASLPSATSYWDNVVLIVSRVFRGADHMVIIGRRPD